MNSGIRISKGEFIATINNDAQADENWINNLVKVIESDPGIGCCGSKMMRYYDRNIIDSAGIVVYQNGNAYDRGSEEEDKGQYDSQEEIFGACAGAALYRRKMLDEIGLFDMDYFAYLEDVDISLECIFSAGNVYLCQMLWFIICILQHQSRLLLLNYSILKEISCGICGNIILPLH